MIKISPSIRNLSKMAHVITNWRGEDIIGQHESLRNPSTSQIVCNIQITNEDNFQKIKIRET